MNPQLNPDEYSTRRWVWLWLLLGFQAGFINSIGFLAFGRFVSHMTGFGSQVGITLGNGNYFQSLEMVSLPISFVLGAFVAGRLTIVPISHGKVPRYDWVAFLIPMILVAIWLAAELDYFGEFGEPLVFTRDFLFLSSLSFVCGLQNACYANLTKGHIRTTHLTGIATDLGSDLALVASGKLSDTEREIARGKNWIRFLTFLTFSLGAVISSIVDARLKFMSLLFPVATSTFIAVLSWMRVNRADRAWRIHLHRKTKTLSSVR